MSSVGQETNDAGPGGGWESCRGLVTDGRAGTASPWASISSLIYLFTWSHFSRTKATAFYLTFPFTLLLQMCPHLLSPSLSTDFFPSGSSYLYCVRVFSIYHSVTVFITKLRFNDKPLLTGLVFLVLEISLLICFLLSLVLFFAWHSSTRDLLRWRQQKPASIVL